MNLTKSILFYIFLCFTSLRGTAQSITVNDTYTAQNLVNLLTNNSNCATTSSASVTGDTFSGPKNSYAYFSAGTSSFPFSEGVLLSTWSSDNSRGPFRRNNGGGNNEWAGDADLNQALGIRSVNSTVLEFDFVPLTNFISFNYIFASNEYQDDFPCRYSDGFAFLIKENGGSGTYRNLAVIPNTTTAVSSQNVRPFTSFTNTSGSTTTCAPLNDQYFGQLNTASTNTSPINYSGQTKALTAQTNVIAGNSYHIKLVIADDEFVYYDSAVFLQAGSFTSKIDLGADRLLTANNGICFGESFIIDTKLPSTNTYRWYKDGATTPIPGETSPSFSATETGTYRVEVEIGSTTCIASGVIKVEFTPETPLSDTALIQCDDNNDGIAIFDLTKADIIIKNNNSGLSEILYFETLSDAQAGIKAIVNTKNYSNTSVNQVIYAKTTNSYTCVNFAQVTLQISNQTIAPYPAEIVCDDDGINDGIYQFDLMTIATSPHFTGLGNNIIVYFYLNANDAYLEKNALPTLFKNTIPYQQTLYARVLNGSNCFGIIPINLVINSFYPPNFQDETIAFCTNSNLNLSVNTGFLSYLWSTGETTNQINVSDPGNYSVKVTDANGCEATKKFNIITSEIATITEIIINDFDGNKNSALIEYSGTGNYEFSIDGTYFQGSPQFDGITAGTYYAYARDKNGCGISDYFTFYVLDYPRFFTPNDDGINDLWMIKNLDLFPKATISIFNRYGKLLKMLNSTSQGWNGSFNGYNLPADDYWFHINFANSKSIKAHFSLKR
ncbi:T9SS type B sorting domain-containing protein [Flavobacterium hiemivividum]|uniref:T9SS type B sorting domain-containing protein n=1 Tax=Flavobacterium hiemivividum TaxID=2541734 RepID=A0A4R5CX30_9FLAO|nr:T9SS type B sorting domain-containing protein [Flavobacterium hiemivividum]TDE02373.1 T9SS type B sorting domain-containing protein [Flavobacterium hiemivividum]